MNWSALAALWPYLLGIFAVWGTVMYVLVTYFDPPVEPVEFSAQCQCGHEFAQHRTQTGIEGSPCFAPNPAYQGLCECDAFEPADRPTEPFTLTTPRYLDAPPGYDFHVYRDPDGADRYALVPTCRHPAYATVDPGSGAPLRCIDCGEELAE
jgi:hypothetical protein